LLVAMRPESWLGRISQAVLGGRLPFSFLGLLIGSVLFNLPFAVRPFIAAFASLDRRLIETSWCLGVSPFDTFRRVTLPLCWPGILAGLVLTFAHCIGEFGVVLMVGGNLAGKTRTLSISVYDDLQSLDYASAGRTSALLLVFALVALTLTQWLARRGNVA
jgi:molybdate transport system permease protein